MHKRFVLVQVVMTGLVAWMLAGCEDPVSPTPGPLPVDGYVGHYHGVSPSTRISLALETDSFNATVFTPRHKAASSSFRASASGRIAATWVKLGGDVTVSGNIIKTTVTRVVRDGQELTTEDLAAYSECSLAASVTAAGKLVNDLLVPVR